MLEKIYTTKMSADKKSLQNRFSKIRVKSGKISKLAALVIFVVILILMVLVTIVIAAKINPNGYYMTGNEFYDYINRPIGAVMADIDYADDNKIVFHYAEGFFIDKLQTEEIDHSINLKRLNIAYNEQGSSVLDIRIDKEGKYAYLSTVGVFDEIIGFDKYIINLESGEVKKGSMPENAEMFSGLSDTFGAVQSPIGWFSDNCIVRGGKTFYLTSETGTVGDIQLVTVDKNDINSKSLFGNDYVSITQQRRNLINNDLSADEEILEDSGLTWETNSDVVKTVLDKIAEYRQIKNINLREGNYDIILYQIKRNDDTFPRMYIIDNYAMKLILAADLTNEEYLALNKTVFNSPNRSYMENSEIALRNFFAAFDKSDLETMKTLVTDEFIDAGYIGGWGMCYGMTRATLDTCSKADVNEYLKNYLARNKNEQLALSENDIGLLNANSEELVVYSVTVTAESNIKGEVKPPHTRFLNVICKRQNNGSYLVHKLD